MAVPITSTKRNGKLGKLFKRNSSGWALALKQPRATLVWTICCARLKDKSLLFRRSTMRRALGSALAVLVLVGLSLATSVGAQRSTGLTRGFHPASFLSVAKGEDHGGAPQRLPIPRAETLPAYFVHATYAVLRGEVNARDGVANFKFQYGRSASYETTLEANEEFVTGHRNSEVAEAITRLRPNTTYHFRIIASNRSGFVVGRDRMFTTKRRDTRSTSLTAVSATAVIVLGASG